MADNELDHNKTPTQGDTRRSAPALEAPPPAAEGAHSAAAREALRRRIAADVEAYLQRGGEIHAIRPDVRADLPTRPEISYGRRSI